MWTDTLPVQLKARVNALIRAQPSSESILNDLHDHLTLNQKKRKIVNSPKVKTPETAPVAAVPAGPTQIEVVDQYNLRYSGPINRSEVICELPNLSFTSPTRRKYNLVFHLYIGSDNAPQPVLLVVNMATSTPEISLRNLQHSVKLCVLLPVLGNTTVASKKDTGMLCFWLHDHAALDKAKNEPIICIINLDLVRKQLAKDGKIHPNAESQVAHLESSDEGIKPVNGLILEFLERQFGLCGIQLNNFMPSSLPSKNALNMNADNSVSVSRAANSENDLVLVEAYKGSKEGALVFVSPAEGSAYLVFGFKKPVVIYNFSDIKNVSYKDITKFTFTVMITVQVGDAETVIDFSMIDQNSFQVIDDFVRARNIDDNSYDVKLKEKGADDKQDGSGDASEPQEVGLSALAGSDDEEDDGSYNEQSSGESDDDDVAEEFESNVESEGDESDPELDDDTAIKLESGDAMKVED